MCRLEVLQQRRVRHGRRGECSQGVRMKRGRGDIVFDERSRRRLATPLFRAHVSMAPQSVRG